MEEKILKELQKINERLNKLELLDKEIKEKALITKLKEENEMLQKENRDLKYSLGNYVVENDYLKRKCFSSNSSSNRI